MLEMYCRFLSEGPCLYLDTLYDPITLTETVKESCILSLSLPFCSVNKGSNFSPVRLGITFKRSCEALGFRGVQTLRNAKMGGVFCWRKTVFQEDLMGCYIYTNLKDIVVKSNLCS